MSGRDETTARWHLPLLHAAQAQKETTHNEALTLIDAVLHPAVEALANDPPDAAMPGDSWIVGTEPVGPWSGRAGSIAVWTLGGWRFVAPQQGLSAWIIGEGVPARREGSEWVVGTIAARSLRIGSEQVVGPRLEPVPAPGGGSTIDHEARAAIAEILDRMVRHGLVESG